MKKIAIISRNILSLVALAAIVFFGGVFRFIGGSEQANFQRDRSEGLSYHGQFAFNFASADVPNGGAGSGGSSPGGGCESGDPQGTSESC